MATVETPPPHTHTTTYIHNHTHILNSTENTFIKFYFKYIHTTHPILYFKYMHNTVNTHPVFYFKYIHNTVNTHPVFYFSYIRHSPHLQGCATVTRQHSVKQFDVFVSGLFKIKMKTII